MHLIEQDSVSACVFMLSDLIHAASLRTTRGVDRPSSADHYIDRDVAKDYGKDYGNDSNEILKIPSGKKPECRDRVRVRYP